MSEYLGWRERRPPVGAVTAFDKETISGGPVTHSYENYVKNIFHPMNRLRKSNLDHGLSPSTILKMEQSLGKYALDDSYDDDHMFLKTPLENLYAELGMKSPETALYRQFPVYIPKQSSEYFAISHGAGRTERDDSYRGSYSSYRERADEDYEKNNKKTLIDYKDFDSSPLSPYLYQSYPYVRSQDSRIVGSNFVQVTSRPKDRFLEKVEQTLAEVRAMPRYK